MLMMGENMRKQAKNRGLVFHHAQLVSKVMFEGQQTVQQE